MKISDRLKSFMLDHEDDINNFRINSLYEGLVDYNESYDARDTCALTEILLKIGINPLDYLDYVPSDYLYKSNIDLDITIPDNIRYINFRSFFGCTNIKNIYIPNSIISINSFAFPYCKCDIIYNGRLEYFKILFDIKEEGNVNKDLKIIANDGELKY